MAAPTRASSPGQTNGHQFCAHDASRSSAAACSRYGAGVGLGVEIEGIGSGKMHFDGSFAAAHGIDSGADKVPVKKNVPGGGEEIHVG